MQWIEPAPFAPTAHSIIGLFQVAEVDHVAICLSY